MNPHVLPVIHHLNSITTISEAEIAFECGATGVFLISHNGEDMDLLPLAAAIKGRFNKYVGVNLLRHSAAEALDYTAVFGLDAMWTDYPGVTSTGMTSEGAYLRTLSQNSNIDVYASVAFKYQPIDENPPQAATLAQGAGWIPTTSGAGTGQAPNVDKIKAMSEATEGWLAIASGMSPENVANYAPYLSHILVSTGVSSDAYHFNKLKLKHFISIINAF